MLERFKKYILKQEFHPGLFGVIFNPFYISRKGLMKAITDLKEDFRVDSVLDVGCGIKPYENILKRKLYWGIDVSGGGHADQAKSCNVYFDGISFPVRSNSIDGVVCSQVLEHVFDQDLFVSEIMRIIKPGGKMIITVPFLWDEHEQPYDNIRYSSYGIAHLLNRHGFVVRKHIKTSNYVESIFQLASAYVFEITKYLNKYLRFLTIITVCAGLQIFGLICSFILPEIKTLYLDNVLLVEKEERK